MTEHPILFSAPMVLALLSGRKSQTRRIINSDRLRVRLPYEVRSDFPEFAPDSLMVAKPGIHRAGMNQHGAVWAVLGKRHLGLHPGEFDFVCPYVEGTTRLPFDEKTRYWEWRIEPHGEQRLWVRETWRCEEGSTRGTNHWATVHYRADDSRQRHEGAHALVLKELKRFGPVWRPSIYMPRWASRLTLEVMSVRVQRLQAITEADAEAEGVKPAFYERGWNEKTCRGGYAVLWDIINGKRGPWASNPWVWAVTFKRINGDRP